MEEKVLIKSERYNIKTLFLCIIAVGACIFAMISIPLVVKTIIESAEYNFIWGLMWGNSINTIFFSALGFLVFPVLIFGLLYLAFNYYELTVTDKRIYGKIAFGKRVDLPVDFVSATATVSLLKGVAVSTSSGKIKFLFMKNAEEIYKVLNTLIIERQSQKNAQPQTITSQSNADELKKYKELLDSGIISQEEFDAKKKQLLGL